MSFQKDAEWECSLSETKRPGTSGLSSFRIGNFWSYRDKKQYPTTHGDTCVSVTLKNDSSLSDDTFLIEVNAQELKELLQYAIQQIELETKK